MSDQSAFCFFESLAHHEPPAQETGEPELPALASPAPRLSRAIERGALLRPQTRHSWIDLAGSCALGAAFDDQYRGTDYAHFVEICVRTGNPNWVASLVVKALESRWPILRAFVRNQVGHGSEADSVLDVILRCNDKLGWSREQIVTWLEIEEKEWERGCSEPLDAGLHLFDR